MFSRVWLERYAAAVLSPNPSDCWIHGTGEGARLLLLLVGVTRAFRKGLGFRVTLNPKP